MISCYCWKSIQRHALTRLSNENIQAGCTCFEDSVRTCATSHLKGRREVGMILHLRSFGGCCEIPLSLVVPSTHVLGTVLWSFCTPTQQNGNSMHKGVIMKNCKSDGTKKTVQRILWVHTGPLCLAPGRRGRSSRELHTL